jgi:hypothetical protein
VVLLILVFARPASLAPASTQARQAGEWFALAFPDVPPDYWASDQILACVDAGIVSGYPDGMYQPAAPVTREQMAVYISRALAHGDGNVPDFASTGSFSDAAGSWALKYIEYAAAQNVLKGYPDGYHPGEQVTRAQAAVYIARAVARPTGDGGLATYTAPSTPSFADVQPDHWAYRYIEHCWAQGIVRGYSDGYHPDEVVNRAELAVYIARAFQLTM